MPAMQHWVLLVTVFTLGKAMGPPDTVSDEEQEWCLDGTCERRSRGNSLLQRASHIDENLQQRAIDDKLVSKDISILQGDLTYNQTQQVPAATRAGPTVLDLSEQDPTVAGAGSETAKAEPSKVLLAVMGAFLIFNLFLVYHCSSQERFADKKHHDLFNLNENGKVYVYNNERLLTCRILLTNTPAIVLSWRVWIVVPCVLLLAYGSALMFVCEFPYANKLETTRIEKFGTYLRVFIAFMLGLYMNNSFGRWQASVTNFRLVLTSVKQLMFQVHVMKLPSGLTEEIQRKCLIACYILDAEVRTDLSCKASACKEHWDGIWKSLEEKNAPDKRGGPRDQKASPGSA
jgi:hypothetical protein